MAEKPRSPTVPPVQAPARGSAPASRASSDVAAFLAAASAVPAPRTGGGQGRLIFALDATLSRGPTWDRAMQMQADMFAETASIGGLSVQLAFFRGHGEFRASAWVQNARDLLGAMTGVGVRGGLTQIGRVLSHAGAETAKKPVSALVYIGDSMEEDADRLCHQAGQLGMRGVRAFIFQEGRDPAAAATFREIARLTGGAYAPFDLNAIAELRAMLAAVAVYAAGGRRALEDYGARKGSAVRRLTHQIR